MASPAHSTYSVGAGQPIHGGRWPGGRLAGNVVLDAVLGAGAMAPNAAELAGAVTLDAVSPSGSMDNGLPVWRNAMQPLTWAVVPTANTLAAVDPEDSPTINPSYPSAAPWHGAGGAAATLNAWGTFIASQDDGRLWMPLGGGHGDYGGNEGYVLDLLEDAPTWSMIGRPSGNAIDGAVVYSDGDTSTGEYTDGRIRSKHGYTDFVHIPGTDDIACMRLSAGFGGGLATALRCWIINGVTGAHTLLDDYSAVTGAAGAHGGGSCWDSVREVIWHMGVTSSSRILATDPATGVTTDHGTTASRAGGLTGMVYVPPLDIIVLLIGRDSLAFDTFDPATDTWTGVPAASVTGSWAAGFSGLYRAAGGVWVPSLNAIAMWDNTSGTTEITLLRPPEGASGWRWDTLPPDAANVVTPSTKNGTHTFGKFGYSEAARGLYLQNEYSGSLYFFSLD